MFSVTSTTGHYSVGVKTSGTAKDTKVSPVTVSCSSTLLPSPSPRTHSPGTMDKNSATVITTVVLVLLVVTIITPVA